MPKTFGKIGIIGGMGPEATADLFRWIIWLTPATKDAENLPVIIHNNPQIPSRVEAIMNDGKSPLPAMKKMVSDLETLKSDVIAIPCNAAHYYLPKLKKATEIPIINMIEETADYINREYPNVKKVGILAPEMTMRTGLYQKALLGRKMHCVLDESHFELVTDLMNTIKSFRYHSVIGIHEEDGEQKVSSIISDDEDEEIIDVIGPKLSTLRETVTPGIYGKHGIKAGYRAEPKRLLTKAANKLRKKGAEVIIMACTEIPLVLRQSDFPKTPLINPTKILAQTTVDASMGIRKFS